MKTAEWRKILEPLVVDVLVNKKAESIELVFTGDTMGLPDAERATITIARKTDYQSTVPASDYIEHVGKLNGEIERLRNENWALVENTRALSVLIEDIQKILEKVRA